MSYSIRRATIGDVEILAEHRARIWTEVGGWKRRELIDQIPQWAEFFRRSIPAENYVAWIAEEEEGLVIGSGAVLKQLHLPRPRGRSEFSGRVQAVYVVPAARRRGIARAIMNEIVAYARERGFLLLALHPSDVARPLYESLGFKAADEMVLHLKRE